MHIIGEGCPGVTSIMVKLAAHLSDFNTCQINSSLNVMNHGNQMDLFKAELVNAYTRAGVKVMIILFRAEDLYCCIYKVFLLRTMVSVSGLIEVKCLLFMT